MKKVTWLMSAALIFNSVGSFFFGQSGALDHSLLSGLWFAVKTGVPIGLCVVLTVMAFGRDRFIEPPNSVFDMWLGRFALAAWIGGAVVGEFYPNEDAFSPYLWMLFSFPMIVGVGYFLARQE